MCMSSNDESKKSGKREREKERENSLEKREGVDERRQH